MAKKYETLDHWSLKAQKEGYPARSVYKLKEIDEKFNLIDAAQSAARNAARNNFFQVLDLGAAPGSWSLYVLRKFSGVKNAFLTAADLSPLSRQYDKGLFDGENFFFVQGDITLPDIRDTLLEKGPYNLVISDAAPATTGNRSVDTLRSLSLVEEVLLYAELGLVKGGSMVVKVFQGGDTSELLRRLKALFKSAKSFKPQACRRESFETYYLGMGKK